MNWNTSKANVVVTAEDDHCSHLKVGEVAANRSREMDSFGPVDSYCRCEACYAEYLKETTPYKLEENHLFHAMKITVRKLLQRAQNAEEAAPFLSMLDTYHSLGFKRIPIADVKGVVRDYNFEIFFGGMYGDQQDSVVVVSPTFTADIIARYNELMGLLSKHLEHEMPGGVWISIPYQPSVTTDFVLMEGNLISTTVARSIDDPSLPAGYRWKSAPEDITVYPVDDYEKVVCSDCKKTFYKKDTIEWKWYDFYPAQGDVPIVVCNDCKGQGKHQHRVATDRANCEAEMGEQDDGGDIDDGGPDYDPNDFDDDDPERV